ncbi:hypothetical protein AB0A95_18440 [Micromonospora sp. NPDC049230]|uniref:hypothetical protein n=1 Tax=Micromonospora sp. NPDC049230 TaxID=3155502 RepID=UPI0033E32E49
MATDALYAGRWDEAALPAVEAIRICTERGLLSFDWYFRYIHSMVAAGRGQVAAARRLTADISRWAVAHQALGVTEHALHARGFSDVSAGDYESAQQNAARLSPPGNSRPIGRPRCSRRSTW